MKGILYGFFVLLLLESCDNERNQLTVKSLIKFDMFLTRNISILDTRISSIPKSNNNQDLILRTDIILNSLEKIREDLTELSGLNENSVKLTKLLDYSLSTEYFLNEDNMVAYRLKKDINEYVSYLNQTLEDEDLKKIINKQLDLRNLIDENKVMISWESANFEHVSILDCIINIEKLEFEIKSIELFILSEIEKKELYANKK